MEAGLHSGTRFKLRWYGFDGARAPAGAFDARRDEPCWAHQFLGDGQLRCRPEIVSSGSAFGDAGCMQPIAFNSQAACPPADYVRIPGINPQDPSDQTIYTRGTGTAPTQYFTGSPVNCSGPFSPMTSNQLALLGPEVGIGEFAPITLGAPTGDGPLRVRYYEADDGARLPTPLDVPTDPYNGLFDSRMSVDCFLDGSPDLAMARCHPITSDVSRDEYVDAQCTIRGIVLNQGPLPPYVKVFDSSCPNGFTGTFAPGALSSTQMLFQKTPGGCIAENAIPGGAYHEIGAELPVPSLSRIPNSPVAGRLQSLRYGDGQIVSGTVGLYDVTLDTPCRPAQISDGSVRCLPFNSLRTSVAYSDDGCRNEIRVTNVPVTCETSSMPKYSVTVLNAQCSFQTSLGSGYEVRKVVGVHDGPVYVIGSLASCAAISGVTSYELSAPVPLDQFAAAALTTDP